MNTGVCGDVGASCDPSNNGADCASGNCLSSGASTIIITDATFGGDCGASDGNVTGIVEGICNGQASCSFVEDIYTFGDPAPGCYKDFSLTYTCSGSDGSQSSFAPAQQLEGATISLSCPSSVCGGE